MDTTLTTEEEAAFTERCRDFLSENTGDGRSVEAGKAFCAAAAEAGLAGLTYPTEFGGAGLTNCLLYTSPSPRDATLSRMPSSA